MSSSSQSGPPSPNSQSRRLRSPEERFGTPPLPLEPVPTIEAPDPFAVLPSTSSARSGKSSRYKTRHQRHRFEREAHHIPVRRSSPRRPISSSGFPSETGVAAASTSSVSEQPAPRVESPTLERIRGERRRVWKRLGVLAAILVVVATGSAALFAPQMNIERVQITGLHATSPDLVKPIAAQLLGHNTFRANKKAVEHSVERVPTIQSARVVLHADFPPRVELRVVERVPILRVGEGTNWWAADETGNPYRRANLHDARLPALTWNGPVQTLQPLDATRFADALRLVEAVRAQGDSPKGETGLGVIRTMQLDSSGDATLTLASVAGAQDLTVRLGNDQWSEKVARAREARLYLARTKREATELNLISLRLPRWTPRTSTDAPVTAPST